MFGMVNMKNFVLGIGILVVFALVLWQGIETFHPSPQWDEYCSEARVPKLVPNESGQIVEDTQETCQENGGKWMNGYCDYYAECQENYDNARDDYSKFVFIVSLIVAILALIVGYAVLNVEPVGSALMASGIWSIFWGTAINWRNFTEIWRFALLLIALILLIWIAYRLNTTGNRKGFWAKLGLRK